MLVFSNQMSSTLMLAALRGWLGFITSIIWVPQEIPGLGLWWWSRPSCALAASRCSSSRRSSPHGDLALNLLICHSASSHSATRYQRFSRRAADWRALRSSLAICVPILYWSIAVPIHMAPRCCWPA